MTAARTVDTFADTAAGLVRFHVSTVAEPADCADVLAELLISIWEDRKSPKRRKAHLPLVQRPTLV